MINDTGSTTFNIFYSKAMTLGYDPIFHRFIGTAGSPIWTDLMTVEIQVIRRNTLPLTNWMSEIAVLIHL